MDYSLVSLCRWSYLQTDHPQENSRGNNSSVRALQIGYFSLPLALQTITDVQNTLVAGSLITLGK